MTPRPPLPTTAALALLGAGAVAFVAVIAKFWGANTQYADRFLVLLGAGYVAWERRHDLAALPVRSEWGWVGSLLVSLPFGRLLGQWLSPTVVGWVLLLAGAVGFPAGWFLQAQSTAKPMVLWWLAVSWLLAAAGLVLLLGGPSHLRRLAFPLLFSLFALPIPSRLLDPLQAILQEGTTKAAYGVFKHVAGMPIKPPDGFVLSLPGGDLGVAEACSGVRSVTALTALAAFVAYLRDFGPGRGTLLLVLAVPVIAAVNALRVVLSGFIQEWFGSKYVQGDWHEALGIAMIFVGLGLILGLARLLSVGSGSRQAAVEDETRPASPASQLPPANWLLPTGSRRMAVAATLLGLAAVGTVAGQLLGRGAEDQVVAAAPLDTIPLALGKWTGQALPIPEYVSEILTFDNAICRQYQDNLGYRAHVWVIYWSSASMVKGYHHPDLCLGNRGYCVTARATAPVPAAGGGAVPVTVRDFALESNTTNRKLVLYWTQTGRRVWTEADEKAAQAGSDHRWMLDRLLGREAPPEAGGRLVVILDAVTTETEKKMVEGRMLELCRLLAGAVYDACPWAAPSPARAPPAPAVAAAPHD